MVHVDPTQVEQIIFNLAVNARDAMPSGGRLTLETANCTLDADYSAQHPGVAPGEYVLLATSDTGTGMTAEVKAHLFEPFFTTKPVDQGTGLGLATTYGAVRQSSGHIDVWSEVGRGATFKIYFRRVVPSGEPAEAPSPPPTLRFGAETVLAVEDDPVVLDLTVRMLRQLGYVVLPAGSPAEALELAKKHHEVIHLLMTDMVMPGLNGRQLVESFLNFHPETKALFTSGYSEDVIAHHGVADAGLDFIGKPYTMQALGDKVRAVLDASAPR
jgi:CheY-like chemotaxis protein